MSGTAQREQDACRISDALEAFGIHAIPADCSEGYVCVVIVHHGAPDAGARGAVLANASGVAGDEWEEKLLYRGRQIPSAVKAAAALDPLRHSRSHALAAMRAVQDEGL